MAETTTLPRLKMAEKKRRALYQAEWREIVVINFEIDPKILRSYVPPKTELDLFEDTAFVTFMARVCKNIKPYGIPIVFARSIEQIQLRFYVRRQVGDEFRHGVCLIRDYVPSGKVNFFLNWMFKHKFEKVKIQRDSKNFENALPSELPVVEYKWKTDDNWNHIKVKARSQIRKQAQTKESFVLDHHWGYSVANGKTYEYSVDYTPWRMWDAQSGSFECDTERVFGRHFVRALRQRPASVFLAQGSDVTIFQPQLIT